MQPNPTGNSGTGYVGPNLSVTPKKKGVLKSVGKEK